MKKEKSIKNKYKLLAFDLDGTLTNDEKEVSKKTNEILHFAQKQGIKCVLASGRPDLGILKIALQLDLFINGGYILAFNGGRIIDCACGEKIFEKIIPVSYYHDIFECRHRFANVEIIAYGEHFIYSENPENEYVKKEGICCDSVPQKVNDIEKFWSCQPAVKFLIVGKHEDLLPVQDYLKNLYKKELGIFFSSPYFLEIVSSGIDKAKSMKLLLKKLKIKQKEMMAFGDGENDIPMLKLAGYGVAMENACDSLKKEADFITKSNNQDGIVYALKELIFKEEKKD